MDWLFSLIAKVRSWLGNMPAALGVSAVLLMILIAAFSKRLGLNDAQVASSVVLLLVLAVAALSVNSLFKDTVSVKVILRTIAGVFVIIAVAAALSVAKTLLFPPVGPIARVKFAAQYIEHDCGTPSQLFTPANVPIGASEEERRKAGMAKFWEWVRDGLEYYQEPNGPDGKPVPDLSARAVVLRSKAPFDKRYENIHGTITIKTSIRIEEGVAFLKSLDGGRPVYRQMWCKCDVTSNDNSAQFVLNEPNQGEEVLMVLRVRDRANKELTGDCDSFGISIKVNP